MPSTLSELGGTVRDTWDFAVNTVAPRWNAGKSITIGLQVTAGAVVAPVSIEANLAYEKASHLFGFKATECGDKAPYCLAAILFMTPPIIPMFQKVLVMFRFMEDWCESEGKESNLCQAIRVRFFFSFFFFFFFSLRIQQNINFLFFF